MRTTLTLDDDVAAALARRRAERGTGLRHEVNELLRAGLAAMSEPPADSAEAYELPTFDPGRMLIADHRALKDLLDEADVERALRHRS
jgi:plasmid stability protein